MVCHRTVWHGACRFVSLKYLMRRRRVSRAIVQLYMARRCFRIVNSTFLFVMLCAIIVIALAATIWVSVAAGGCMAEMFNTFNCQPQFWR